MKVQMSSAERWTVGMLSFIALVTFFFPLISLHVPIAGDMQYTGYDAIAKSRQFTRSLNPGGGAQGNSEVEAKEEPHEMADKASPAPSEIPPVIARASLSLKMAWLIPALIAVSFLGALLSLVGSFVSWPLTRVGSTVGGILGLGAILHTVVLNSDMHAMYSELMSATKADLKDNPFAGLVETFGQLVANAFQLKPGAGLYVLVIALGLAAFLTHSRLLARIRIAKSPE